MEFTGQKIKALEKFYRINLLHSITGFKSANLIATKSKAGHENVAVFNSVVHYGSAPPLLGFMLRPTTVARHTYENIKETGFYTLNAIDKAIFKEAHHTSAKYPREVSEFSKTQLNPIYKEGFWAPFVENTAIQIGMKFVEEHKIKANDTLLVLGQVDYLFVKDELIEEDGFVNLCKGNIAFSSGLDAYGFPQERERLPYQRPRK